MLDRAKLEPSIQLCSIVWPGLYNIQLNGISLELLGFLVSNDTNVNGIERKKSFEIIFERRRHLKGR